MEQFETPVGTKVVVVLAAAALAVAGAVLRDFGTAQSSSDVIIVTPADSSVEAPSDVIIVTPADSSVEAPAELDVDELVPGQSVQIEPLDLDLDLD